MISDIDSAPEEWRQIIGFEGFYEVSSFGRVKRCGGRPWRGKNRRIMRLTKSAAGYFLLGLNRPGQKTKAAFVHALVAEAFIGPRPAGHQINHVDGNKANNRPKNLSYCTPSENMRHAIDVLGRKIGYARNPKLTEEIVREIRALYDDGYTDRMIAKRLSMARSTVFFARKSDHWAHITYPRVWLEARPK